MRSGAVIVVALLAYLGFEAYAIKRAGHRTRPAYIHTLLIKATTATEQCSQVDAVLKDRFERTLARTINRYRVVLAEENPGLSAADVDARIAEQAKLAQESVAAELADSDCSEQVMKDHVRRYEIYARKTR